MSQPWTNIKRWAFLLHFDRKPSSVLHFLSISASIKSPTRQQGIVPSVCCSAHYDEHQYMTTQAVWMCLCRRQWWPNLLHICWDSSAIKETYFHLGRQHHKMLNYFTILLWLFVYYHTIASVFVQPGWAQCFFLWWIVALWQQWKKKEYFLIDGLS